MEKDEGMKKKIFVDTNILISGIFFPGNEAKLLADPNIELVTSNVVIEELKEVALRKFSSLKVESQKVALEELENSIGDLSIVKGNSYLSFVPKVSNLVEGKADRKILAAALYSKSDYLVTGDEHFHNERVKKKIEVKFTREILRELKII